MSNFDTLMAQQQVWAAHHQALRDALATEHMVRTAGLVLHPFARLQAMLGALLHRMGSEQQAPVAPTLEQAHG